MGGTLFLFDGYDEITEKENFCGEYTWKEPKVKEEYSICYSNYCAFEDFLDKEFAGYNLTASDLICYNGDDLNIEPIQNREAFKEGLAKIIERIDEDHPMWYYCIRILGGLLEGWNVGYEL